GWYRQIGVIALGLKAGHYLVDPSGMFGFHEDGAEAQDIVPADQRQMETALRGAGEDFLRFGRIAGRPNHDIELRFDGDEPVAGFAEVFRQFESRLPRCGEPFREFAVFRQWQKTLRGPERNGRRTGP